MASKGNANRQTLDERMKEYEAVTTSYSLIHKIPVYARVDGRAFHTFCRSLDKPFDNDWLAKITSLQGVIQASLKFFLKIFQNFAKMQHFQE